MDSQQLLEFFGETVAGVGAVIGQPMTAHQLKLVDRAWKEKYMDALVVAPCAHPLEERVGEYYCLICGRNTRTEWKTSCSSL